MAEYSITDSMSGEWTAMSNPCTVPDADKTFYGQSAHVIKVVGREYAYIAMF